VVDLRRPWYGFGDEPRNDEDTVGVLHSMWLDYGEILVYDEPLTAGDFSTG
jgi:hypothetical protein